MTLKYVRDSLPWLVPSAAIVFAASGFLEFGSDDDASATAEQVATVAAVAPANAALPATASEEEEVVARQNATGAALTAVGGVGTQVQPLAAVQPVQPAPVTTPERTAALAAAPNAAPLFTANPTGAGDSQQCVDDLRSMANQARVYFPSGGLTAEESGIEQGRLLGLIAQSCPGVQIKVEGHSDPSGDPAANLRLSQARAEQVIKRIGASGIDTSMFFADGIGDRQPSGITGPQPSSYYDRRVEFSIVEAVTRVAVRAPATAKPWATASCVTALQRAADSTTLFYAPRSVSLRSNDLDTAMTLAPMAMECPQARLRVVGHHDGNAEAGEGVATGLLRAKALMAMLVGRGATPEEIIIAAPSRSLSGTSQPASRVQFDVILEEG